jgi:hypothetical protein
LLKVRDYARARLNEALEHVRSRAVISPEYIILVVDSFCANLINQLGSRQYDLIERKFFQVEDLNLVRKRYPMTDVLYFIEPTRQSIDKVLNDFKADDPIEYD